MHMMMPHTQLLDPLSAIEQIAFAPDHGTWNDRAAAIGRYINNLQLAPQVRLTALAVSAYMTLHADRVNVLYNVGVTTPEQAAQIQAQTQRIVTNLHQLFALARGRRVAFQE